MRSQTDDSEMRQASCAGEPNTADYPAMREEEVIGWLQKPWIFRTFAQSMAYAALAAMRRIVAADSGATCRATRDHCLRAKQQAHVSRYESKKEANCCIARRSRKVAEASRMAGFRLPPDENHRQVPGLARANETSRRVPGRR